jgi:hypothetical protein
MPTSALFGEEVGIRLPFGRVSKHANAKRAHPKGATRGRVTGMLHPTNSGRAAVKLLKRQRKTR